jgi:adenylate cyclase
VDLGVLRVKDIQEPIRAYQVGAPSETQQAAPERVAEVENPPPLPDRPSIAVLPFENMSGDPEQEYFADGMVEEITTALSRFKWLFVIARNSSFTFKGKAVDVKEVGRRLGVRYVLEGSVRKASGKVRITGQLIDAATGTHIWADRFERDLTDIFALQDELTVAVI